MTPENHKLTNHAAKIFADYLNSPLNIRGMGRSMLDSIDSYLNQDLNHLSTIKKYPPWLNRSDLRKVKNRAFIEKISQSDNVKDIYAAAENLDLSKDVNLICDHVVPCTIMIDYLEKSHPKKGNLTAQDVIDFHQTYYRRCILTESENNELKEAGFNSKMPDGWCYKTGDIFARYKHQKVNFHWANKLS